MPTVAVEAMRGEAADARDHREGRDDREQALTAD
jgi:hypothetical protein